jgi:CheY-like chemotaxis protein
MLQEEERPITAERLAVKTILIVEDDEDTQAFFTEALSLLTPFRVQVVRDGNEALHFATQIKPSLFILDFRLPKMNGIQLYDQLHATPELENIPAIIISAMADEQITRQLEGRKLIHIEKPFDLDAFLDTVTQALA